MASRGEDNVDLQRSLREDDFFRLREDKDQADAAEKNAAKQIVPKTSISDEPPLEKLDSSDFFANYGRDGGSMPGIKVWPAGIEYAENERTLLLPPSPPEESILLQIRHNIRMRKWRLLVSLTSANVFMLIMIIPPWGKWYELWFYLEPTRGFVPLCVSYIWFFYLLHNVRMTNYTDYELHMMGYDVSSLEGRATLRCYRNPGKYAPPKFRAKPIEPRTEDGHLILKSARTAATSPTASTSRSGVVGARVSPRTKTSLFRSFHNAFGRLNKIEVIEEVSDEDGSAASRNARNINVSQPKPQTGEDVENQGGTDRPGSSRAPFFGAAMAYGRSEITSGRPTSSAQLSGAASTRTALAGNKIDHNKHKSGQQPPAKFVSFIQLPEKAMTVRQRGADPWECTQAAVGEGEGGGNYLKPAQDADGNLLVDPDGNPLSVLPSGQFAPVIFTEKPIFVSGTMSKKGQPLLLEPFSGATGKEVHDDDEEEAGAPRSRTFEVEGWRSRTARSAMKIREKRSLDLIRESGTTSTRKSAAENERPDEDEQGDDGDFVMVSSSLGTTMASRPGEFLAADENEYEIELEQEQGCCVLSCRARGCGAQRDISASFNERPLAVVGEPVRPLGRSSAAEAAADGTTSAQQQAEVPDLLLAPGSSTADGGTVLAVRSGTATPDIMSFTGGMSGDGEAGDTGALANVIEPRGAQVNDQKSLLEISQTEGQRLAATANVHGAVSTHYLVEYPAVKEGFIVVGGKYDLLARDRCCYCRTMPVCTVWDSIGWAIPKGCIYILTYWTLFCYLLGWILLLCCVVHDATVQYKVLGEFLSEVEKEKTAPGSGDVFALHYLAENAVTQFGQVVPTVPVPGKWIFEEGSGFLSPAPAAAAASSFLELDVQGTGSGRAEINVDAAGSTTGGVGVAHTLVMPPLSTPDHAVGDNQQEPGTRAGASSSPRSPPAIMRSYVAIPAAEAVARAARPLVSEQQVQLDVPRPQRPEDILFGDRLERNRRRARTETPRRRTHQARRIFSRGALSSSSKQLHPMADPTASRRYEHLRKDWLKWVHQHMDWVPRKIWVYLPCGSGRYTQILRGTHCHSLTSWALTSWSGHALSIIAPYQVHQHMDWVPRKIWVYLPCGSLSSPFEVASLRKFSFLHPPSDGWKINVVTPLNVHKLLQPHEFAVHVETRELAMSLCAGGPPRNGKDNASNGTRTASSDPETEELPIKISVGDVEVGDGVENPEFSEMTTRTELAALRLKERVRFSIVSKYGGIFVDLELILGHERHGFERIVPNLAPQNLEEEFRYARSRYAAGSGQCTVFSQPRDTPAQLRTPGRAQRHPLGFFQACPPNQLFFTLLSYELGKIYSLQMEDEDKFYVEDVLRKNNGITNLFYPPQRIVNSWRVDELLERGKNAEKPTILLPELKTKYYAAVMAVAASFNLVEAHHEKFFRMFAWRFEAMDLQEQSNEETAANGGSSDRLAVWEFFRHVFHGVHHWPSALGMGLMHMSFYHFFRLPEDYYGKRFLGHTVLRARISGSWDKFAERISTGGTLDFDWLQYLVGEDGTSFRSDAEQWAATAIAKKMLNNQARWAMWKHHNPPSEEWEKEDREWKKPLKEGLAMRIEEL